MSPSFIFKAESDDAVVPSVDDSVNVPPVKSRTAGVIGIVENSKTPRMLKLWHLMGMLKDWNHLC